MGGTLLSGCQIPFRQYCTGLPVCGNAKGAEMPDTLLGPEGSGHYRAPAPPSGGARCSKCLSFWSDRAPFGEPGETGPHALRTVVNTRHTKNSARGLPVP
jgi:hypothetical protein